LGYLRHPPRNFALRFVTLLPHNHRTRTSAAVIVQGGNFVVASGNGQERGRKPNTPCPYSFKVDGKITYKAANQEHR
jgi:hypothetical protein